MSLLMLQDSPERNLQYESGWKHKKTAGYIPAENVPGGSVMLLASLQYGSWLRYHVAQLVPSQGPVIHTRPCS